MRIGIFGGTFDPIHNGHIGVVEYALKNGDFDQIRIIVAGNPYQKSQPEVDGKTRVDWVETAIKHNFNDVSKIVVDDREINRQGETYTIDTVLELKKEIPNSKYTLIVGDDIPESFNTWHRYKELNELVDLFVVPRSLIDISSSEIRNLIRMGKPFREHIPQEIAIDIETKGFYGFNGI